MSEVLINHQEQQNQAFQGMKETKYLPELFVSPNIIHETVTNNWILAKVTQVSLKSIATLCLPLQIPYTGKKEANQDLNIYSYHITSTEAQCIANAQSSTKVLVAPADSPLAVQVPEKEHVRLSLAPAEKSLVQIDTEHWTLFVFCQFKSLRFLMKPQQLH